MPEKQIIDLINKIIVHRKSSKHHASKGDNITNLNNNSPKNLLNTVITNYHHNPELINSMEVYPRHNSNNSIGSNDKYNNTMQHINSNFNSNNSLEKDNNLYSKSNQNFFNNKDNNQNNKKQNNIENRFNENNFKDELKQINNNKKTRYLDEEKEDNNFSNNKMTSSLDNFISIKEDHDLSNNNSNSRINRYKDN